MPSKRKPNAPRQAHPQQHHPHNPQHQDQHQHHQHQHHHHHHQHIPSENQYYYDTDPNLTDTAEMPPYRMPKTPATDYDELNFRVIRRYYPDLRQILAIAPFAVIYQYSPDTSSWEKKDVEGTGFVCRLGSRSPGYERKDYWAFIILNRKRLENFCIRLERVTSPEDIEITDIYAIIPVNESGDDGEDDKTVVYGVWMYEDLQSRDGIPSQKKIVEDKIVECAAFAAASRGRSFAAHPGDSGATVEGYQQADGYGAETWEHGNQGVPEYYSDAQATSAVPVQTEVGKQIDVMSLFGSGTHQQPVRPAGYDAAWQPQQQQQSDSIPENFQTQESQPPPPQHAQPRFKAAADTDFFRTSNTPNALSSPQALPQPTALLDLFNSAKKA